MQDDDPVTALDETLHPEKYDPPHPEEAVIQAERELEERMGHTDGGALFLRTYRHLSEGEKRVQARRFEAHVRASLDKEGTSAVGRHRSTNDPTPTPCTGAIRPGVRGAQCSDACQVR